MAIQNQTLRKLCMMLPFFCLFCLGLQAQPNTPSTDKASKVEKDAELAKLLATGNETKGVEGVSYTVLSNILQHDELQEVQFKVTVDRLQNVLIEVFNDTGELVEVIYNDLIQPSNIKAFMVSGKKWDDGVYYLRVTSEDRIENHEIIF